MKKCWLCNQVKDLELFSKKWDSKLQSFCKSCQSGYSKTHYANHKKDYFNRNKAQKSKNRHDFYEYMSDKKCTDCWVNDRRVLEFDHLRDKSYNIGNQITNKKLTTLMPELEKCEIVCCNCHRIRTLSRMGSKK